MSGPARSVVSRTLAEALAKWPRDPLRPTCQLQDVVGKRLERELAQSPDAASEAQVKQVNALASLLENRYQTKYRIAGHLMQPQSNPTHYADLIKELEDAPSRSWLARMGKRLGGLIRFKA